MRRFGRRPLYMLPALPPMRTLIIFCLSVAGFCSGGAALAQDTLYLRGGTPLYGRVREVSSSEVRYTVAAAPEGSLYVIRTQELERIHYPGGRRDMFVASAAPNVAETPAATAAGVATASAADEVAIGRQEAQDNFHPGGAISGTVISTLVFTPLGLIVAATTASTPPRPVGITAQHAAVSPVYTQAYSQEAHRIKRRKVWTAFGVSMAMNVVIGTMVYLSTQ